MQYSNLIEEELCSKTTNQSSYRYGKIFSGVYLSLVVLSILINALVYQQTIHKYDQFYSTAHYFKQYLRFSATLSISLLHHLVYAWTSLKNPGIIYRNGLLDYEENKFNSAKAIISELQGYKDGQNTVKNCLCTVCHIYKQGRSTHCSYCQICIEEYSHHCPWIGKCIGKGNKTSFKMLKVLTWGYFLVNFVVLLMN